ncbi:pre-mRNA-splicing factor CWC25 homolog isoform X1 [Astyanax mexicanus]|uniref:pre-mRNA-splicing factor CWC25 homolog isoform X1 n=1 Tax=Astyanax mexicanus TaxID=7994 RepID=UPI000BBD9ED9|nr:pre-mRNA-splicing factor CWC25 homolog isoform X1 [Astyanax mexicanus]
MGGGDLNLKKSWHPQTLKNIERVWKAEQKHEAERKKIEELQKELKEERAREEITRFAQETGALKKKDERLDWMYQGPAGQISREEYLLGRPVDKQILQQYEEPESGPSSETGLLPGSIFNPTTAASNLDMAAKIREDPLFEIRKREEDKKRSVLTNPVKMKEIQKMLRQNLEKEKDKKKKRKKDKKEKREEKERRKEKKHKRRSSSSDEEDRKHSRSKEENGVSSNSHSHHKPGYGLQLPASKSHHSSESSHSDHRRDRSRSPLRHRDERNHHSSHDSDRKSKAKAPSPPRHRERYHRPQTTNYSKRLSAEELERKRKEMMGFARDREEERESNVKKYKRQDEQDKARDDAKHSQHASFIHNMKLESAATSTVEDRVKRNIHSIQRTSASLEKNFMRR